MLRVHALGLIAMGPVMSITVTSPVIPLYLDGLGLPPQHVGGIIGATSLAIIVTELLAMAMSHLLGRRRTGILALVPSALMFGTFPLAADASGKRPPSPRPSPPARSSASSPFPQDSSCGRSTTPTPGIRWPPTYTYCTALLPSRVHGC